MAKGSVEMAGGSTYGRGLDLRFPRLELEFLAVQFPLN
jgi:hypothetical protein